jgi:hypothetical protein
MHQREVVQFAAGQGLISGPAPLELAARPGADLEALKKDVFGHFIAKTTVAVETDGPDALTRELMEFDDCVRTGGRPHVSGVEACLAMEAADRILDRIATHQWDGHADGAIGPYPHAMPAIRKAA